MLGVTRFPGDTPADEVMRGVAARLGVGDTFEHTPVGVWFGEDGVDPYFGGAGPLRNGCDLRGACMTGCPHGAKNSLDRNYLWLAERSGAEIHPDTKVERPRARGQIGRSRRVAGSFRARDVVLAAGVLGTLGILFRSGLGGPRVGDDVRTNSEVLVGASARGTRVDYSRGVAITSMIRADEHTQIQPVRYGKGSNLMGLLGTILVDEAGPARWLAAALRHPAAFARSLWLRRWSERTVILLVMQTRDNAPARADDQARPPDHARLRRAGHDPGRERGGEDRRGARRRRRGQLDQRGRAGHADDRAHPRRRLRRVGRRPLSPRARRAGPARRRRGGGEREPRRQPVADDRGPGRARLLVLAQPAATTTRARRSALPTSRSRRSRRSGRRCRPRRPQRCGPKRPRA